MKSAIGGLCLVVVVLLIFFAGCTNLSSSSTNSTAHITQAPSSSDTTGPSPTSPVVVAGTSVVTTNMTTLPSSTLSTVTPSQTITSTTTIGTTATRTSDTSGVPATTDMTTVITTVPTPKTSTPVVTTMTSAVTNSPNALISFVEVPPRGSTKAVKGTATVDSVSKYRVVVYVKVDNRWWGPKPTWANPMTTISPDGSWTTEIVTGGNDSQSTEIAAFLVPSTFTPPKMEGGKDLPVSLDQYPSKTVNR